MSVINKMLRDLDSRQPNQASGAARSSGGQLDLTAGTVALGSQNAASAASDDQPGHSLRVGLLALVVGVVAGLGWWINQRPEPMPLTAMPPATPTPATPASVTVVAQVANPPVVSPATEASDSLTFAQPAVSAAIAAPVARERPPATAASAKVVTPKPVEILAAAKALPAKILTDRLKDATELPAIQLATRSSEPSAGIAPRAATPPAAAGFEAPKLRPLAAQDVLAQAQERWNLGQRTPAIALLQDAITRLEGAGASEATALAALTREYVRMTLAQGQASAASAMLARLEQPLAGVADIWALRGNVAQRLGHHPEAVRAYLKSLALRANEPRWMLGAAVSLAAQGQVGPAGELAEQARQAGALQPDVANYLRQLGVAVAPD